MQLSHSFAFGHQVATTLDKLPEVYYDGITPLLAAVKNVRWEQEADRSEARLMEKRANPGGWEDVK